MSVEPHPHKTTASPGLVFTFECSRQDRLQALEAGLDYRIGRRSYRWLGILLGIVIAFAALLLPISWMAGLLLAASMAIIAVLVLWPVYMRLQAASKTAAVPSLTVEINNAVVVCRSGNEELTRHPWLSFVGTVRNRHGIALLFGTRPSVVWLPARIFDDSSHAESVVRFVQGCVDGLRSRLMSARV